jgi:hypothetical protein
MNHQQEEGLDVMDKQLEDYAGIAEWIRGFIHKGDEGWVKENISRQIPELEKLAPALRKMPQGISCNFDELFKAMKALDNHYKGSFALPDDVVEILKLYAADQCCKLPSIIADGNK